MDIHQVQMTDFTANCAIYHHQINFNNIDFSLDFSFLEKTITKEKNFTYKPFKKLFHFQYKSSRAPPYYC
jgi:hypothetical protein